MRQFGTTQRKDRIMKHAEKDRWSDPEELQVRKLMNLLA